MSRQVMQMVESLCKLAGDRTGLVVDAPAGPHQSLLGSIDQRLAELGTASSEADLKLEDNQNQRQESESFRGTPSRKHCRELHVLILKLLLCTRGKVVCSYGSNAIAICKWKWRLLMGQWEMRGKPCAK